MYAVCMQKNCLGARVFFENSQNVFFIYISAGLAVNLEH